MWLDVLKRSSRIFRKRIATIYQGAPFAPTGPSIVDAPHDEPSESEGHPTALPPLARRTEDLGWIRFGDVLLAVPLDAIAAREIVAVCRTFISMHRLPVLGDLSISPDLMASCTESGHVVVGTVLRGDILRLRDAWFTDTHGLRLNVAPVPNVYRVRKLRMFQVVPTSGDTANLQEVCDSGLISTYPAVVDVVMANPLMPLLIIAVDADGLAVGAGLLAFPGFCRGGLYYGEVRALAPTAHPTDALLAYDRARLDDLKNCKPALRAILSDHGSATGNEPLYSTEVEEWLAQVFGLSVLPSDETIVNGPTLRLPPDCLPTVAALVAPVLGPASEQERPIAHVVCDDISFQPRHTVVLPVSGPSLEVLQCGRGMAFPSLRGGGGGVTDGGTVPLLALRFRRQTGLHPNALLLPQALEQSAPQSPRTQSNSKEDIFCHLQLDNSAATERTLGTLLGQSAASRLRLLVTTESEEALVVAKAMLSRFPGGWERTPAEWDPFRARGGTEALALFAEAPPNAILLTLARGVILHDPRTVEMLSELVAIEGVGMAGCVSLAEKPARRGTVLSVENGGYFPTHIDVAGGPTLVFSAMDTLDLLPNATYPVIAPPEEAFALRLSALRDAHAADPLLPGGAQPALQTGIILTALGHICLCTSAVRTLTFAPPTYREAMDPVTLARLPVGRWQDLLGRITLIQRVS